MALAWMAVGMKPAAEWDLSVVARAKPKGRVPGRLWTPEEPGYRGSFEVGDKTRDLACEIEAAAREAGWLIGPGGGKWDDALIVAINQKSFDHLKAALVDDSGERDVSLGRALGYPESAIQAYARREESLLESLIPDELFPYQIFSLSTNPAELALLAEARRRIIAAAGVDDQEAIRNLRASRESWLDRIVAIGA